MNSTVGISTAQDLIKAPLLYKGKVRELYDLGDKFLLVVTDRISAFDFILSPPIPDKGNVLNRVSAYWFEQTASIQKSHFIHADVNQLGDDIVVSEEARELLKDRITVGHKAERIDVECVVRGYITGNGWRQYQKNGEVNGIKLPDGLRKNSKLAEPIFTPAAKHDVGHDVDITWDELVEKVGVALATQLRDHSIKLYEQAHQKCLEKGILIADCKFEFGMLNGELILIDEIFTPDCSRFWDQSKYALDIEIDSMDKEPVRQYLANSDWDKVSEPDPLPEHVVAETRSRYVDIWQRLTQ